MGSRPPNMGSEPPTMGSQGSRTEHAWALNRTQAGSGADPCRDPIWLSRTFLLPAQAETRCCHVAYCARHKPAGGTWHDASRLRVLSHSLRIRRAPVHSTSRRRAQSTIRGPCPYSHVTDYQCCMDCGHQDSRFRRY
jgi:hypothetical protein